MVFHRFAHHLSRAKNFGANMYNQAQRMRSAIDEGARFAKRAFHVVSPALRELGVNTTQLDRGADRAFTGYNQLRDKVVRGNEVIGRTAGRLAGLT